MPWLARRPGRFVSHLAASDLPQFFIDGPEQGFRTVRRTLLDALQQPGDLAHGATVQNYRQTGYSKIRRFGD